MSTSSYICRVLRMIHRGRKKSASEEILIKNGSEKLKDSIVPPIERSDLISGKANDVLYRRG